MQLRHGLLRCLAGARHAATTRTGSSLSTATTSSRTESGHVDGVLTASTSGAVQAVQAAAVPARPAPALLGDALFQQPLTGSGKRAADPGEPKYTAPYWVPPRVRHQLQLPPVLFIDPWRSAEDPELRRRHAQLCLDHLIAAGRPMTAVELFSGVNEALGPTFAHPSYVRMLMENLRKNRVVYGKTNPQSKLRHSMPYHPRLYVPLPYQAAEAGPPQLLAQQRAEQQARSIAHAYKRLKNSKPPYPIFRKKAEFSMLQWAQAMKAIDALPQARAKSLRPAAGGAAALVP